MQTTLPNVKLADAAIPRDPDREAFVALLDDHGAAVLATLRRLCGNVHDADDLFQETASRVWRNIGKRPWLRSPRAWLVKIAYHVFLDSRKRTRQETSESAIDFPDYRHGSPDVHAASAEMRERLNQSVDALPSELRQVIALHYQGGLTIRQTAATMDTTIAITKNRLHAALKRLRSELQ